MLKKFIPRVFIEEFNLKKVAPGPTSTLSNGTLARAPCKVVCCTSPSSVVDPPTCNPHPGWSGRGDPDTELVDSERRCRKVCRTNAN
jgi:hypothetical protein